MTNHHYILEGHQVKIVSLKTWGKWFETADRRVALTQIGKAHTYDVNLRWKDKLIFGYTLKNGKSVEVSTVFLGLDHNWGTGAPLLFETMVFTDGDGGYCRRYSTWEEAERGHQETVNRFDWRKREFWQAHRDELWREIRRWQT